MTTGEKRWERSVAEFAHETHDREWDVDREIAPRRRSHSIAVREGCRCAHCSHYNNDKTGCGTEEEMMDDIQG